VAGAAAGAVHLGVALSRVVLGLHYPSDVLAATGIAILLASASWPGAAAGVAPGMRSLR
jgi:membrane-associated phospholipid phosphatase